PNRVPHSFPTRRSSDLPGGLRQGQLAPLTCLLAVCDVYAALCSPRPYRSARDPRTALTDTLLLAEQGLLDRTQCERLLLLAFYRSEEHTSELQSRENLV